MRQSTVAGKPAYFFTAAEPVPDELREAAQRHECWLVVERGTLNVDLAAAAIASYLRATALTPLHHNQTEPAKLSEHTKS